MAKLNQIVAVEKGLKARVGTEISEIYKDLQKPQLFAGLSRTYRPVDDEGETFPSERTLVQRSVKTELNNAAEQLTKLIDVTFTKDVANTQATGTVSVHGADLFSAPVPFLLFLEKQLVNLRTMIGKVPLLDPAEVWVPDGSVGGHRTTPTETTRTRKIPKVLVKYPATDKHPAQTEVYTVDEVVGRWESTRFSGAVNQDQRDRWLIRVDELLDAIKHAVEEANQHNVTQMQVGETLFSFLLG